jgi:putative methyltransferase
MNFYLKAAEILDRLDAKQGSIKGLVNLLPEKDRKRVAALIIETLKCTVTLCHSLVVFPECDPLLDKAVLTELIEKSKIMVEERKHLKTLNLTLLLVHDILLSNGIQASDGPLKQAIHRHKTRLHGELQKIKVKRGVRSDQELSQGVDVRSGIVSFVKFEREGTRVKSSIHSEDTTLCSCQYGNLVHGGCDPVLRFPGIPFKSAF